MACVSLLDTFFAPPLSVRGMKVLERASFRREVVLPAIKLRPTLCSKFLQKLKHVTLKYPGIKTLLNAETLESKEPSEHRVGQLRVGYRYFLLPSQHLQDINTLIQDINTWDSLPVHLFTAGCGEDNY